MTEPKERIPHADRPTARDKCRCLWIYTSNPKDPQGPHQEHLYTIHPMCPLHGEHVERSPF